MTLQFPWDDPEKLSELELGFAKLSGGKFRGCTFSSDGFCIRILCPRGVDNVQDYYHRKKFYAIVVQAFVDSTGKFVAASFKAVGSTHDSLAMKMSKFWQRLMSGELSKPTGLCGLQCYFGVGDDAYENNEFFVTPWPGRNLPTDKDVFNYFQSRCRIVVECAFGRLTTRWGCLWRPLAVHFTKVPKLVLALMKLHNLCDEEEVIRIAAEDMQHFMKLHQAPSVFTNDSPLSGKELHDHRTRRRVEVRNSRKNYTRSCVTEHLRKIGAARPPHSRYRARTKQTTRLDTMAGKAPRRVAPTSPPPTPPADAAPPPAAVAAAAVMETPPPPPADAAPPPKPQKRRRPKNYHWSHKKKKGKSRRRLPLARIISIEAGDGIYMHVCMHACMY